MTPSPQLHPEARACGKVILLGEHSVVHGHPALAAGLPNGLSLRARKLPDPAAHCELHIPGWDLDLTLEADTEHPVARASLAVLGHCDGPIVGWRIEGDTRLPSRAGLGSSAALCVAMARLALGEAAPPDAVVEASLAGERVFHGQPSGLDSEVATRGGVLSFVRGEAPVRVAVAAPLHLVVVASGIPRSTSVQVARVQDRLNRLPKVVRPLLDALGESARAGQGAMIDNDPHRLGEIMDVAHEVLSALGVSTPVLDQLCSRARSRGALGAKLTGAGGGGSIIALAQPERAGALASAFCDDGLEAFAVELTPK